MIAFEHAAFDDHYRCDLSANKWFGAGTKYGLIEVCLDQERVHGCVALEKLSVLRRVFYEMRHTRIITKIIANSALHK